MSSCYRRNIQMPPLPVVEKEQLVGWTTSRSFFLQGHRVICCGQCKPVDTGQVRQCVLTGCVDGGQVKCIVQCTCNICVSCLLWGQVGAVQVNGEHGSFFFAASCCDRLLRCCVQWRCAFRRARSHTQEMRSSSL